MSEKRDVPEVLDEGCRFSLREVCELCDAEVTVVRQIVGEGIVAPEGDRPERWHFTGVHLLRIKRALRLQRHLHVNLPGAALALDLLDELERLRRRRR